jgi:hypothetical protein
VKKLLIFLALLGLALPAQSAVVGAIGASFENYADNFGVSFLTGIQADIVNFGDNFSVQGRTLFAKLNFGSKNIDNIALGPIFYTHTNLWDIGIGIHSDFVYEVAPSDDDNWQIGGELYKPALVKNLNIMGFVIDQVDVYVAGDVLFRGKDAPTTLSFLRTGVVLHM